MYTSLELPQASRAVSIRSLFLVFPSLDFANMGQPGQENILLGRSADGKNNFRVLYGRECEAFKDKYRDVVEVCPLRASFEPIR